MDQLMVQVHLSGLCWIFVLLVKDMTFIQRNVERLETLNVNGKMSNLAHLG